jgi:general L-amino acid transport system substrate-binding protein
MKKKMTKTKKLISVALVGTLSGGIANAQTLDEVRDRGTLNCGVSQGAVGFASPDEDGRISGLDVDICRAVAAMVLADSEAVKYVALSSTERFVALQSGEVDLLSRTTTWTFSRDAVIGVDFVGINYYDGQGFMVPRSLGITSATELDQATICMRQGTTSALNVADYFRSNGMEYTPVIFEAADEVVAAYGAGRCDAYSIDRGGLAGDRLKLENPEDHVILPETISKEPLGPAVRQNDSQWADIVRWSLNILIIAEELGITQDNVEELKANSENPEIRRLLGVEGEYGTQIGLDNDFAARIISAVGNYGESFERSRGMGSPLMEERGLNALWLEGGLMYAPPFR